MIEEWDELKRAGKLWDKDRQGDVRREREDSLLKFDRGHHLDSKAYPLFIM
jgi:hypothetical protein